MSTAAILNIKSANRFLYSMLIYLSVSSGCNSSFENAEKAHKELNNPAVDITKVPRKELREYVGRIVRITGTPIDGKVFGDFTAPFGEIIVHGGVFWPDDLLDKTIEIEGKLIFWKPEPAPETDAAEEVVAQSAIPDPEVGGWYMIEDAKIIVASLKSDATSDHDISVEDPFGGF